MFSKVDFFHTGTTEKALKRHPASKSTLGNIKMASEIAIFEIKVNIIFERRKIRDLFDALFLIQVAKNLSKVNNQ